MIKNGISYLCIIIVIDDGDDGDVVDVVVITTLTIGAEVYCNGFICVSLSPAKRMKRSA